MSLNQELQLERPMDDLRHELILNVVRTANLMSLQGNTLFRRYGLTEAQFNVLFALKYKMRAWTQSDLSKRLVVTRASITSVLDKLETKGLVRRVAVPGNRRIYHVELTDRGRTLADAVEPVYRQAVHEACRPLTDTQCRALIRQLEELRAGVAGVNEG